VLSNWIVLTQAARNDLASIENYIAENDGETHALAIRARLDKAIENLAAMPGIGGSRSYLKPGRRAFPVPPWTIYHVPLSDGIRVLRVIDGRRDLPGLFGKRKKKK
jgi:toxin ParE1/3/4